jgi:hypothetical protein
LGNIKVCIVNHIEHEVTTRESRNQIKGPHPLAPSPLKERGKIGRIYWLPFSFKEKGLGDEFCGIGIAILRIHISVRNKRTSPLEELVIRA